MGVRKLSVGILLCAITAVGASAAFAASDPAIGGPRVITRQEWGAREPQCNSRVAGRVQHAIVHHTSGRSDFTDKGDTMARLREIQDDHMDARGFCDVGYNFFIDAAGNIFEGAAGSLERAVVGAHARGFNTGSVGVALLGDFTTNVPSEEMLQAAGEIIGWRLSHYGVDPAADITRYPASQNLVWPYGEPATFPAIAGHNTFGITDCPGAQVVTRLPQIRQAAADVADDLRATGQFGAGVVDAGFRVTPLMFVGVLVVGVVTFFGVFAVRVAIRVRREQRSEPHSWQS
ncbi:MAG: peptidoglycan recognition protein [Promicromonosporaceae bacterium]|nr:peptidoglycan recognition protein [Promicromonosporaceae bacterium]